MNSLEPEFGREPHAIQTESQNMLNFPKRPGILQYGISTVNQWASMASISSSEYCARSNGIVDVDESVGDVEPLGEQADAGDFELLELRGELAIQLDPQTRIPVEVSGSRAGVGDITLRLIDASAAAGTDLRR